MTGEFHTLVEYFAQYFVIAKKLLIGMKKEKENKQTNITYFIIAVANFCSRLVEASLFIMYFIDEINWSFNDGSASKSWIGTQKIKHLY